MAAAAASQQRRRQRGPPLHPRRRRRPTGDRRRRRPCRRRRHGRPPRRRAGWGRGGRGGTAAVNPRGKQPSYQRPPSIRVTWMPGGVREGELLPAAQACHDRERHTRLRVGAKAAAASAGRWSLSRLPSRSGSDHKLYRLDTLVAPQICLSFCFPIEVFHSIRLVDISWISRGHSALQQRLQCIGKLLRSEGFRRSVW